MKPSLFKHFELLEVEQSTGTPARLTLLGLSTQVDANGVFEWVPQRLRAEIFPYEPNIDMEAALQALVAGGFVVRYEVEGYKRPLGLLPTFLRHNRPHRHERPVYPMPPLQLVAVDQQSKIQPPDVQWSNSKRPKDDPETDQSPHPSGARASLDPNTLDPHMLDPHSLDAGARVSADRIAQLFEAAVGKPPLAAWLSANAEKFGALPEAHIRHLFEKAAKKAHTSPEGLATSLANAGDGPHKDGRKVGGRKAPTAAPIPPDHVACPVCGAGEMPVGSGWTPVECPACKGAAHLPAAAADGMHRHLACNGAGCEACDRGMTPTPMDDQPLDDAPQNNQEPSP